METRCPTLLAVVSLSFGLACSERAKVDGPDADTDPGDTADDTSPAEDTAEPEDSGPPDADETGEPGGDDTGAEEPIECVDSAQVVCFPTDIGPSAVEGWETAAVLVPGKVLVFPFTHGDATDGEQYGHVVTVGATGATEQGHTLRAWHSRAPAGEPLAGDCAWPMIPDGVYRWNQNKDVSGYCRLPDEAGRLYWNYALCSSSADDFICADDTAVFAPEDYRFRVASTVIAY